MYPIRSNRIRNTDWTVRVNNEEHFLWNLERKILNMNMGMRIQVTIIVVKAKNDSSSASLKLSVSVFCIGEIKNAAGLT